MKKVPFEPLLAMTSHQIIFHILLSLTLFGFVFSKFVNEDVVEESGNAANHQPLDEASQFCSNKPEIKYSSEEFKDRLLQNCIKAVLKEQVRQQQYSFYRMVKNSSHIFSYDNNEETPFAKGLIHKLCEYP